MPPKTPLRSLTPKQKQLLDYIESFSQEHGYAPSQKEIAAHFGFSSLGTVQNYLVRLQEAEFLEKTWNGKRTLRVSPTLTTDRTSSRGDSRKGDSRLEVPPPTSIRPLSDSSRRGLSSQQTSALMEVPLLGKVAAGQPIESLIHNESLSIPVELFGKALRGRGEIFALKVQGDSMIDDGILDGDVVLIRKASRADNGQKVVALIENEATIKTFQRKKDQIELHPANPRYKPIIVKDLESFRIEGVFVGLIRSPAR